MRRVDVNRVTQIGAAAGGGGPASVLLRCMTTQGFSNPLPDDTAGHGHDDIPAAPATAHPAPPLVDPSSFPRGTSPNTKHTVREQHKWQETIASFDAPSQSSLKRTFHHQYLPNTSPEIPNYVVDEGMERSGHGMLTARNANLATPGHSRGATLGDWLKSTRGAPLARPHIPSSSSAPTPIPSTNPHLAAARVGDDHKHPSMIHPGLQRKRLEEEKAAYDLAVEESTRDALVQHEQQQGSVTEGEEPRLVVQHRDFRGEVIRAATEEFYDPETGGLKANTGSATASEQAMRARIFDGNAGFAFKTSGGSTSGGAGSVMVKNMVLDRGIEEEIIANRRKAALGIGELGIREKVKKMEQAEREYEDELTPEGREVYRKAKLDAAQLAGRVERDEASAKERRLKALTGDDDNSSFDRLRSASRVAASRLTHQGLDSEYPDVVEGAPPIRESLSRGGGDATLQPQLKQAPSPSSSKRKAPLPFLAEEEYAYGGGVDTAAQSSSSTGAASAAAATSMSTQHTSATTSFLHQDDLEEDQLATPMDLMSAARATKQYPVATTVPKQFSFHSPNETPLHPKDYLASFDPVPNNTPVPEAPMWTSSLSVPLRARRILGDTWRNPQVSSGEVPEPTVHAFQRWMEDVCPKLKSDQVFSKNIVVKPRQMFTKGLYARRQFKKGDIIATIPVVSYETNADGVQVERSPFGSHMTIESLLRHSTAVRDRNVPSIATMHPVFAMKTSATRDTEMHPLFEEQLYLAMLVACEKDAADRRRLSNCNNDGNNNVDHDGGEVVDAKEVCAFGPYFDTIAALAVDDEYIREINKENIEPHQGLEYIDHEGRIASYIRRIQRHWPDAPHYDTLLWATRFVLSRQRMLPMRDDFADQRPDANVKVGGSSTTPTPSPSPSPSILSKGRVDEVWGGGPGQSVLQVEEASLDWLSRFQRWVRETALSAVLPSASVEAAKEARLINDRRVVPTVVPLVDMIMHDFKGVGSVVVEQVKTENLPSSSPSQTATSTANTTGRVVSRGYSFLGDGLMSPEERAEELRLQASPPSPDTPRDDFTLVVRANRDMQVGEELTMVYPKCYSVSYTLFKYGFLALRPRALDTSVTRQQWGEERKGSSATTDQPSAATSLPKSDAAATLPPPATPAV